MSQRAPEPTLWAPAPAAPEPAPPAHHSAPPGTSEVAARAIADRAPTMRDRILAAIHSRGRRGLTDAEGEAALGLRPQTYTPRRGELAERGLVVDSGERRPTPSGRPATVWIAPGCPSADAGAGGGP